MSIQSSPEAAQSLGAINVGTNKKDSPEPPETVLVLSRLEEHVNVLKIAWACCRIVAAK